MTVGSWSGPFPSGSADYHQPPAIIRLDTTKNVRHAEYYNVVPNVPKLGTRMLPGWHFRSPDSLGVFWSSGFAGVTLDLVVRSDSLVGTAQAFTDVMGLVQPSAPVFGVRIPCPKELAKSAN